MNELSPILKTSIIGHTAYTLNHIICGVIGGFIGRALSLPLGSSHLFLTRLTGFCLGMVLGHDLDLGKRYALSKLNTDIVNYCDDLYKRCMNVTNETLQEKILLTLQQELELLKSDMIHLRSALPILISAIGFFAVTNYFNVEDMVDGLVNYFNYLPRPAIKLMIDAAVHSLGLTIGAPLDVFVPVSRNRLTR